MPQQREVREVQNPALLAVGCRPDVLIWRQHVGLFRTYHDPDRVIHVGTPGMADSGAIVRVTITPEMVGKTVGIAVQPEFKTKRGTQRVAQEDWQRAVEQRGGIYQLVRSPADMTDLVARVQRGDW